MSDEKKKGSIDVEILAEALAKALKGSQPTAGMLTGMSEERLERVQGKHDKPIRQRIIKGKSPDTGATFDMVVLESRTHKNGRVVRLDHYTHPPEAYLTQSQGGMMPDGNNIWRDGKANGKLSDETPTTELSVFFKQWRYETFWKADLQRIANGAALRVEACVDGAKALETPWVDTQLFSESAAE